MQMIRSRSGEDGFSALMRCNLLDIIVAIAAVRGLADVGSRMMTVCRRQCGPRVGNWI